MVRAKRASRKAAFKAALALAETTVEAWAKTSGVTSGHLYQVLDGRRESATLTEKVDEFIAEQLPDIRVGAA